MAVTIKQVAEAAKCSNATVSRVLSGNGAELFAEKTRKRIERAAQRLGYRPNHAARALATGKTQLVALWTCQPYHAFLGMMIQEVQRQAVLTGYGVVVSDIAMRPPGQRGPNCSACPTDGIFALDCGGGMGDPAKSLPASHAPLVSMGTALIPRMDQVRLDLGGAFRDAVRHLVAEGCRRIAYMGCRPPTIAENLVRSVFGAPRNAYRAAMQEARLPQEMIDLKTFSREAARRTIVDHVHQFGCPDGILCRTDELAIGVARGLWDLGKVIGRDVLVVGCDGTEDTHFFPCPLSTIVLPVAAMCEAGWALLRRRMETPRASTKEIVLQGKLEVRESSKRQGPLGGRSPQGLGKNA